MKPYTHTQNIQNICYSVALRKATNSIRAKSYEKHDEFEDYYSTLGWEQWKTRLEIQKNDMGARQCMQTGCPNY